METTATPALNIQQIAANILDTIDKEREREIITRRFGLHGRKETLEEIGNLLGITRERVRQIEKQALDKLQQIEHPYRETLEQHFTAALEALGRIAPLHEVSAHSGTEDHAHVNFLAHLIPEVAVIPENDHFYHSLALSSHHDVKSVKQLHDELIKTVKQHKQPLSLSELHQSFGQDIEEHHLHGLARSSKLLATLDERWGLASWPQVNPKSIRDKIYIILQREQKPMHFSDIAENIKNSDFRRKNVTTQAIHNELIKDKRFVLVGRGIYALNEWGFSKGTVADVIEKVLSEESPLHRDEIIQRVLKQRHVKPTTIILNLQGKEQFKRVAKATYALAE
ncbi:MAG: sigma factor-like helix-turn-helix DNA-binding protein [Candidatus Saccharimonadales bacterium]